MALPTDKDLLALAATGGLADALSERFGLTDNNELRAVRAACARLHNTGQWNLIAFLESGALQALETRAFFAGLLMLEPIIPDLETTPERLMACVEALVARGDGDGFANQPNAALLAWCAKVPARAHAVVELARAGDALASRNLTFALQALGDADLAHSLLTDEHAGCWMGAVTALGRMPDAAGSLQASTVAAFARLAGRGGRDLDLNLLQAIAGLLSQPAATVGQGELEIVDQLLLTTDDQVIHAAASALMNFVGARRREVAPRLLGAIRHVKPALKGTVHTIDLALSMLLQEGQADLVVDFVTALFSGPGELALAELKAFLEQLVNGPEDVLAHTAVRWLLGGEARLCSALSEALHQHDDAAPALDVTEPVRGLTAAEQAFVCRKAIGWFLVKPRTAASVLVSVLRVCDEATGRVVGGYLAEPMLLNFGGLRDYLDGLDGGDAAEPRVAAALAYNAAYLAALRDAPEVKELAPSETQRRVQRARMTDQAREIHKQARKHSVFYDLVKHSVVLHGRRSRTRVKQADGSDRWVQMDLKPMSAGYELPRMMFLDPVHLDYMLLGFRNEVFTP